MKSKISLNLVGREREMTQIRACLQAQRNVLLEGPVGVGKTHLAIAVTRELGTPIFRVDGDNRYSEQKLSGWFDPPTVIKKGFSSDAFIPGPLVDAMKSGGILFINELNRLPEGVQNVLLPAIDERIIMVPRLGEIKAAAGFLVIATQNPKEFVATSHLSEAILDRFELVILDHQSEEDEVAIVKDRLQTYEREKKLHPLLPLASVRLTRLTREHPRIRRGASVRAALSIAEISQVMILNGMKWEEAFLEAALLALPTRIEIEREADSDQSVREEMESLLKEWVELTLKDLQNPNVKKKDLSSEHSEKNRTNQYQSIFSNSQPQKESQPFFFSPEEFGVGAEMEPSELPLDLHQASPWDVATRYHEFKSMKSAQGIAKKLRKLSAFAILERARAILGSVVHPVEQKTSPLNEVPSYALQPDFDLDETLENSPLAIASVVGAVSGLANDSYPLTEGDIWMSYHIHRRQPIILSVDTSLSMTGEKLALTAVALSVVLLEFPDDPIGIIAFENESKILKWPDERLSVPELVERFLDVPAQGYTHLEDGMRSALRLVQSTEKSGQGRPPSTVLLTDGKYTAGKDPAYLASRFPHLVVLKMGRERASLELCRDMAKRGKGALREVDELEALPSVMYGVVKDLLRGRSLNS